MSDRQLVQLADRFPNLSRMTLWRIERTESLPIPVVIRGRRYYYADELEAWESRRRAKPQHATAAEQPTT